ncbi:hypothetical protein D3C74_23500 [compost metagenome]
MFKRTGTNFVVINHDSRTFNVIESGVNQKWLEQRVLEQRQKGMDVRGYSSEKPVDELKEGYHKQYGYTYTRDSVLLPNE